MVAGITQGTESTIATLAQSAVEAVSAPRLLNSKSASGTLPNKPGNQSLIVPGQ